jgi:hypothetical protein
MAQQYYDRPKAPLRVQEMLRDLSRARPGLTKLRGKGKDYDPLIDVIVAIGPKDWPLPASKALQEQFGINAAKLRKWLDALYWDFMTAIEEDPDLLQFRQVSYLFCVPGFRDYRTFQCRLPVPPRVGDTVMLPFISEVTGSSRYYVDSMHQEYQDDQVCVVVNLKRGIYNQHMAYLIDQALFEGKLTYGMLIELGDYRIEDYLRTLYPPSSSSASSAYAALNLPVTARKRRGQRH